LRLHNFLTTLGKEWRELMASRAFWLLLLMIGPLVGHGFITAVNLYAEASGAGGSSAALAQGLTPLDGILVPMLGAYDLAAAFLFPFVAIRAMSSEKQSGALKLALQLPGSLTAKVSAKGLVLLVAWFIALLPGLAAMILWKSYGGHLYGPETANLIAGHLLRAMLSGAIAVAAAAIAESAASAAIVTLGFTVGTWAIDFIAFGRGGLLQQLANYTPTAALQFFEQGMLRLNTVIVMVVIVIAGFAVAIVWLDTGRRLSVRLFATLAVVVVLAGLMLAVGSMRTSWDLSENRRNSFPVADEAALRGISDPLRITVYLSPEDPRLTDFEQNILKKLRRILPRLQVEYAANSQTGLFEGAEERYGEIWYELKGQRVMERSTIDEVVLEQIYRLAGINAPAPVETEAFSGYPLAARPRWAAGTFYAGWPLLVAFMWWLVRR
jgi:ABC-2 type transport system permease protein